MTETLIIRAADNGLMLSGEGWSKVIVDTHNIDNIALELGKVLHDLIIQAMDCEFTDIIKMKIEIEEEK